MDTLLKSPFSKRWRHSMGWVHDCPSSTLDTNYTNPSLIRSPRIAIKFMIQNIRDFLKFFQVLSLAFQRRCATTWPSIGVDPPAEILQRASRCPLWDWCISIHDKQNPRRHFVMTPDPHTSYTSLSSPRLGLLHTPGRLPQQPSRWVQVASWSFVQESVVGDTYCTL